MTESKSIPAGLQFATLGLLFITPAASNLVKHVGSSILLVMTLFGIYTFFKMGRISFAKKEKAVMAVFVAYFLVNLIMAMAHNAAAGIRIFKVDMDHEIRMLTFIPIYYLFIRIRPKKSFIWCGIIAGAVASGIYALFAGIAIDFSDRVIGPYNPCLFGYFSVALSFMSLSGYHFFYKLNKKLILLPLSGFACGLLAAFFSGTRGSVITIPLLFVIFLFQVRLLLKSINTRIVLGGAAAVFVFLLLLFPHLKLAERFQKGIDEAQYFIKNRDCVECIGKYDAHHLRMWMEAALIIKDTPFFGVGFKGYRKIVTQRVDNGQIAAGIEIFDEPHNMYLTMWTSYGIVGLVILLAFFLTPLSVLFHCIRKEGKGWEGNFGDRDISYCGIYLVVGYMLFSLTGALFIRNMLISFYIIMLAAVISVNRPDDRRTLPERTSRTP
ncbi:MAG: O-antigen ligase family protein [Desulfosalsimonadaceae bacterium]